LRNPLFLIIDVDVMARPVNANPEATRRRILMAARTTFSLRGPGGTGLREVAKRARVGLATVTHYFPTKQSLEDAVVEAIIQELAGLREELMPLLADQPTPSEALRRIIATTYRYVREHLSEVRMLMRLVVDSGHAQEDVTRRMFLPVLDQGSLLLSSVSGAPLDHARMVLLSLNHLIIRYGITNPAELVLVTGVPAQAANAVELAVQHVEAHLVSTVLAALGLPSATEPSHVG
jgi:AcrR family transcriptional regulator